MYRTSLIIIAAFVALTPACVSKQADAHTEQREPHDGRLMPPEQVTEDVWYMRQPPRIWSAVIGNVGIVEQSDGVVLIDSGGSIPDGRDIVAEVAKLTSKPIKAVAITHWHNDHPLGVPGILEHFPAARIIATDETARMMPEMIGKSVGVGRNDPKLDRARVESTTTRIGEYRAKALAAALPEDERRQYALEASFIGERLKRQMGGYVALPTETFTDRLLLDDPVAPVELRFLGRANTGGDLVAWLPKQRLLFTGDIVVAPSPYGFNSSIRGWIPVLERLKAIDFAHLVPGHGAVQHDRSYLDTLIWSMSDVGDQVREAVATGKSAEETLAGFDQSRHITRFGAASPWAVRILRGYWLKPIVSSAYREIKDGEVVEGS